MKRTCYLVFLLLCFPLSALASIEISEIAWMGSSESANHEWIELYNDGGSQSVDGWQITDGNNLTIDLAGTISANSYAVLERTSDSSAPGSAFGIYTGALTNSGATLTLLDNTGSMIDQVVGGDGWQRVGGDNETKETAQKTNDGWGTGPATPGVSAAGVSEPADEAEETSSHKETVATSDTETKSNSSTSKTAKKKASSEAITLTLPDVTLQLDIVSPAFVHVNQPVTFSVNPSGIGDTLIDSLQYNWNFGDGMTGSEKEVQHIFTYPGTYVVVVAGAYKRQQQVVRTQIEVLPVELAVTVDANGDVMVINQGEDEIDVSHYRLVGHETFSFPKYSILLPGQTIVVPANLVKTDTVGAMVALYDQEDEVLAMSLPSVATYKSESNRVSKESTHNFTSSITPTPRISAFSRTEVIDQSPIRTSDRFTFVNSQHSESPAGAAVALAGGLGTSSQVAEVAQAAWKLPGEWPLYTLIGILLLGIFSMYLIPAQKRGED